MLWIKFMKDALPWKKDSDNDFVAILTSANLFSPPLFTLYARAAPIYLRTHAES